MRAPEPLPVVEVPRQMKPSPGRPETVDRDLLHAFMAKHRRPDGKLDRTAKDLANDMLLIRSHLVSIFQEFQAEGRIRKMGRGVYVVDPAIWRWEHPRPVGVKKF